MRVVILTGMSGSGKSTALRALEDIGFYAIDNFPLALLDSLLEIFKEAPKDVDQVAVVFDARTLALGALGINQVVSLLERTREAGHTVDLVFLDASDELLERRYKETRRRHPMSIQGSVGGGIRKERELLHPLRRTATMVMNTSLLSVHDLKKEMHSAFWEGAEAGIGLTVTVMSFGFKHGVPSEADLMFDVRFLPNPYFVEELRPKTGEDDDVYNYVLERDEAKQFLEKTKALLEFLIPCYENEGRSYLTIAIGCTGGRHRSVAMARTIGGWIESLERRVQVRHRDVGLGKGRRTSDSPNLRNLPTDDLQVVLDSPKTDS